MLVHGREDWRSYRELAFSVVNNAIDDLKKYRYSKTDNGRRLYSEALAFLSGCPMLSFWCEVIGADETRVVEGVKNGNVYAQF